MEAYCVKCKARRAMTNPVATRMKNGRSATKGKCSSCGTGMFRIGSGTTSAAKRPAAKRPAAKRPAAKRPAAKRPAAKRPAAKRPAAKRPAAKRSKKR